ncbi:MAG: DUF3187 family protein [Kiritimatiellia bacterium]
MTAYLGRIRATGCTAIIVSVLSVVLGAGCASLLPRPVDDRSNVGLGHLSVESVSPGHILRPGISAMTIPRYERGSRRVTSGATWGNVWNYKPPHFIVDGEWLKLETRLTYTLLQNVEVALTVPYSFRYGGSADAAIENFHDALGLKSAHREDQPRDQVVIDIVNNDGEEFLLEGRSAGINDLLFFISLLATRGTENTPALFANVSETRS